MSTSILIVEVELECLSTKARDFQLRVLLVGRVRLLALGSGGGMRGNPTIPNY